MAEITRASVGRVRLDLSKRVSQARAVDAQERVVLAKAGHAAGSLICLVRRITQLLHRHHGNLRCSPPDGPSLAPAGVRCPVDSQPFRHAVFVLHGC